MVNKDCQNCRYSLGTEKGLKGLFCHRYPPKQFPLPMTDIVQIQAIIANKIVFISQFPKVEPTDLCGEYKEEK